MRSASGEIAGMFAAGITVMVDVAVLLARFASVVALVTVAVFVTGPGVDGRVTVIVNVTDAPPFRVAAVHVIVVVPVQAPAGVEPVNVVPAGSTSVTETAVAGVALVLVTTMVQVSGKPVP